MERPFVRTYHQHRYIVVAEIFWTSLHDCSQWRLNHIPWLQVSQQTNGPQEPCLAQHLTIFIAGFNQCIRIDDDVIAASSCATGRISRFLLADVAGHGNSVAATARFADSHATLSSTVWIRPSL
jgi:hypothetical protein